MAKKENENKEIATVGQNEIVPDYIKQNTNRGSENVELDDITIPRLEIVQALSPCRKKTDPSYIEGAEEGMLFNNVTRELFKECVYVVPIIFKKEYIVWKDRESGGGFRGAFERVEDAHNEIAKLLSEGDNGPFDAVDTAQHFCLILEYDDNKNIKRVNEIVISMSRSKMKVSRQWNSMIRILGGDRFSRVYKLTAVEDSSDKGEYYNFKVEQAGFPSKEVYEKAEEIYTEISKGDRAIEINRDMDEKTETIVDTENSEF